MGKALSIGKLYCDAKQMTTSRRLSVPPLVGCSGGLASWEQMPASRVHRPVAGLVLVLAICSPSEHSLIRFEKQPLLTRPIIRPGFKLAAQIENKRGPSSAGRHLDGNKL